MTLFLYLSPILLQALSINFAFKFIRQMLKLLNFWLLFCYFLLLLISLTLQLISDTLLRLRKFDIDFTPNQWIFLLNRWIFKVLSQSCILSLLQRLLPPQIKFFHSVFYILKMFLNLLFFMIDCLNVTFLCLFSNFWYFGLGRYHLILQDSLHFNSNHKFLKIGRIGFLYFTVNVRPAHITHNILNLLLYSRWIFK